MASRQRAENYVTRNLGKSVSVTLNSGKVWEGILDQKKDGKKVYFTVKTGKRGRPPMFLEDEIRTIKPYRVDTAAKTAEKTPIKKAAVKQERKSRASTKTQAIPSQRSEREPTAAELEQAEALATELLAEPLNA